MFICTFYCTGWSVIHGRVFWHLVKRDLSSVSYFTRVHCTSYFFTRYQKHTDMFNWSPCTQKRGRFRPLWKIRYALRRCKNVLLANTYSYDWEKGSYFLSLLSSTIEIFSYFFILPISSSSEGLIRIAYIMDVNRLGRVYLTQFEEKNYFLMVLKEGP